MTKYVHIVYVHPVENGEPNLYKVEAEREFDALEQAQLHVVKWNETFGNNLRAVYYGRVNDATGELE